MRYVEGQGDKEREWKIPLPYVRFIDREKERTLNFLGCSVKSLIWWVIRIWKQKKTITRGKVKENKLKQNKERKKQFFFQRDPISRPAPIRQRGDDETVGHGQSATQLGQGSPSATGKPINLT